MIKYDRLGDKKNVECGYEELFGAIIRRAVEDYAENFKDAEFLDAQKYLFEPQHLEAELTYYGIANSIGTIRKEAKERRKQNV